MDVSAIYDKPELTDGAYLLEAALAAGMNIDLFPRQVMVCWHPDDPSTRTSFVHGVPESSTLSGVTYAQDKRMVRALLQRAGVTSTKGATFSFRGRQAALRYADRVRYPVTVRMAIDDSIRTPGRVAANRTELEAVIDDLRRIREDSLASATNLRRSAYSLTGLLDPDEDEHGTKLLNRSTRVLIERIPSGPMVHVLVLDGDVAAAVEVSPSPDEEGRHTDVTAALSEEHHDAAIRAAAAVPGLRVAHVVLVPRKPSRLLRRQSYLIHDVSERLGLDVFESARTPWGMELATAILQRRSVPVTKPHPSGRATFDLRCEGVNDLETLSSVLSEMGSVHDRDPVEGWLDSTVEAPRSELAERLAATTSSGLNGARAMLIEVRRTEAAA